MTSTSWPGSVVATNSFGTVTLMRYVPGASPSKANAPLSSVLADRDSPLANVSLTSTRARPNSVSWSKPSALRSTNAWPRTAPDPATAVGDAATAGEADGCGVGETEVPTGCVAAPG